MIIRTMILCCLSCASPHAQAFVDLLDEFTDESIPAETTANIVIEEEKVRPENRADPISQLLSQPEKPLPEAPPPKRITTNGVTLQGLDTETGRVYAIDAPVGQTIEFGTLRIQVKKCLKNAPGERAESVAFLTIHEYKNHQDPIPYFSGWMFSTSPSLSALDHPVYDVWVKKCVDLP